MSTVSHAKDLLRTGDGLETLIHLRDRHRLHMAVAVGRQNRVRRVNRHTEARQLISVDLVPATFRQRLDQPHHLDACLKRVIPRDQPDVPAADDEEPLRGSHQVAVDQRLEGPRAIHPRQRVPPKRQRLLPRAACDEQDFRLNEHIFCLRSMEYGVWSKVGRFMIHDS